MKKIILLVGLVGFFGISLSYADMRPGYDMYNMYNGPEVKEERAEGATYVPPEREIINSRYGEDIDARQTEFTPDSNNQRLFDSYSQP
jgi:hypothetical protein